MLRLTLEKNRKRPYRILCLGAHSDDIEIGCGGTILRLIAEHRNLSAYWVVFSSTPERHREARKAAQLFLKGALEKTIVVKDFRNSFFPFVGNEIKEYFEQLKSQVSPDLIFTHCRDDLHQDHRLLSQLTWNTFRDHLILEYEIPKYDGDLGTPNCYVDLPAVACQKKIRYLLSAFRTQREENSWFTADTFRALLRLRGIESNARGGYAEAFHVRKFVF